MQSGSAGGFHFAHNVGQTPAKPSPASPDNEDVWTDSSLKNKQQIKSLLQMNCFTGGDTLTVRTVRFHYCPQARSTMCLCAHKVSSRLSLTRLRRLSVSGSPYYINGKCSVEDNTHMIG